MQNPTYILDIETTSLDPIDGRVICIGIKLADKYSEPLLPEYIFNNDEEAKMLIAFWVWYEKFKPRLAGFNIYAFDMYYLKIRSAFHRLHVPRFSSYIDMRIILSPPERRKDDKTRRRMVDWCDFFGISYTDKIEGSMVPALFAEGRLDEIIAHARADLEREAQLYNILNDAGLV